VDTTQVKKDIKIIEKGKPGRIFLLGTSEVLKDNLVDREGRSQNAIFLMNVLDHLNGRSDIALMRSKQQQIRLLDDDTSAGAKAFVKTFNIAVLPLLVVAAGILVWIRRKARKRRIEARFKRVG
jgi:ABC-type uncharacterized transport system involved in gliding motility auxiliary subunit